MDRSGELALVVTTLPDSDAAERLVRSLLDERLVACGNFFPGVRSLYRWEGKVADETEVLVLLKAHTAAIEQLFTRVAELHPYAVPELVELPVSGVSQAYCRWVMESTRKGA